MKSFSPENAQIELAWNLDARLKFVAGSPPVGGPFTSPAKATPEPRPMNNAAETAAAEREHFIASSFVCEPKPGNLSALLQAGQVRRLADATSSEPGAGLQSGCDPNASYSSGRSLPFRVLASGPSARFVRQARPTP